MVIPVPIEWRAHKRADRYLFERNGWTLRYQERVRPLSRFTAIVEAVTAERSFVESERGPLERLLTDEGEPAAIMWLEGRLGTSATALVVGSVCGDDFYSLLVGHAPVGERPACVAACHSLLRADSLGLGTRRRRFLYRPPIGWSGRAEGLAAQWFHPRFPREAAIVVVPPACPTPPHSTTVIADLLAADATRGEVAQVQRPHTTISATGLKSELARWELRRPAAPTTHKLVGVCSDDLYTYPVRLEVAGAEPSAEAVAVFVALMSSIERLPPPSSTLATSQYSASTLIWAD